MSFRLNLDPFLQTVQGGPQGLDLAEETIDGVIKQIDTELAELNPEAFAFAASIQDSSYGGADSAANLALHYNRAHEVIWKTLRGIREDLESFQQACRDAKNEIISADEDSYDRIRITRDAVDALASGSTSREGQRQYDDARQGQDVTGGRDA
jgi:hypothetical protein